MLGFQMRVDSPIQGCEQTFLIVMENYNRINNHNLYADYSTSQEPSTTLRAYLLVLIPRSINKVINASFSTDCHSRGGCIIRLHRSTVPNGSMPIHHQQSRPAELQRRSAQATFSHERLRQLFHHGRSEWGSGWRWCDESA